MNALVGYQAGSAAELPHSVRIKFNSDDVTRSDLITRWIEFWCQKNCESEWRVEEYDRHVDVHFESEQEMVLFRLSPEFDLN